MSAMKPTRVWMTIGLLALGAEAGKASDHLDTPSVIADPRVDIGDIYVWTAPDSRRLNLVMTLVGHGFSDRADDVLHIDSGRRFGATERTVKIACRFESAERVRCAAGDADLAQGDSSRPGGLQGQAGRFRVFAGLRDDPFFNNVRPNQPALRQS